MKTCIYVTEVENLKYFGVNVGYIFYVIRSTENIWLVGDYNWDEA